MSTIAHVGTSHAADSARAGADAARIALAGLAGRTPSVALVFASADHDHEALVSAIGDTIPGVPLVGCAGPGVIARTGAPLTRTAAVMAIASDRVRFETFLVDDYAADPARAGRALAAQINAAGPDVRGLCLLPDAGFGDCRALLDVLHDRLEVPMPVVGGAVAGVTASESAVQYGRGRVVRGGLAALLIAGPVDVEVAVSPDVRDTRGAERVRDSHPSLAPDLVLQFTGAPDPVAVALRELLGAETPWIGVRSSGEIAPVAGQPHLHSEALALCALYEHAA